MVTLIAPTVTLTAPTVAFTAPTVAVTVAVIALIALKTLATRIAHTAITVVSLTVGHLENGVVARDFGQLVPHVCDVTVVQHPFQIGSGLVRLILPASSSVVTCHGTYQRCRGQLTYKVKVNTASQSAPGSDNKSLIL